MKITKRQLKSIIREVIEEGKGSISKKMRRRKAQKKYKERQLRKMNTKELLEVADEVGTAFPINYDDTTYDLDEAIIDGIIEAEEEV